MAIHGDAESGRPSRRFLHADRGAPSGAGDMQHREPERPALSSGIPTSDVSEEVEGPEAARRMDGERGRRDEHDGRDERDDGVRAQDLRRGAGASVRRRVVRARGRCWPRADRAGVGRAGAWPMARQQFDVGSPTTSTRRQDRGAGSPTRRPARDMLPASGLREDADRGVMEFQVVRTIALATERDPSRTECVRRGRDSVAAE